MAATELGELQKQQKDKDMTEQCRVTTDIRAHTLAQPDRQEMDEIESRIYMRTLELMCEGEECDPFSEDGFSNAIENIDIKEILSAFRGHNYKLAGKLLSAALAEFNYSKAKKIAEQEYSWN